MTVPRTTALTWLAIGVAAFAVFLGAVRWPAWAALAVSVVIAAGGCALTAFYRRGSSANPLDLAASPAVILTPPQAEYQRQDISDLPLPSARADYRFAFSATVLWRPADTTPGMPVAVALGPLAVAEIVRRASELTVGRDPADCSLALLELVVALGKARPDAAMRVYTLAESVRLTVSEDDKMRLDRFASIRKDEELREYERRREQSERRYLGDDVLKSPGSAVVWWLAKNDDQIEKAAASIGVLTQLSDAVNRADMPNGSASPLGHADFTDANGSGDPDQAATSPVACFAAFTDSLGFAPGTDQHRLLTALVAKVAAGYGQETVADELTRRYGTAAAPEASDDGPDSPTWTDEGQPYD